jgi:hypothetical protein
VRIYGTLGPPAGPRRAVGRLRPGPKRGYERGTLLRPVPYVEYDENEAVCPQCGSVFRSPEVLEEHRRESHAGPARTTAPTAPKAVRCSVCGARLSSVTALGRHNREAHVT